MVASANFEPGIRSQSLAWFVDPPLADEYQPGEDQGLRPGPTFGKATFDKQLIGPLLRCQPSLVLFGQRRERPAIMPGPVAQLSLDPAQTAPFRRYGGH
jgi:hypothetical protein